jgi:phosphate starvation-inducible membrane PsiE
MESMQNKIRSNPKIGEDQTNDHNSIEEILLLGYFLKTMKLVIMIFNISFFVGIFFFVFCDLQAQIYASQEADLRE